MVVEIFEMLSYRSLYRRYFYLKQKEIHQKMRQKSSPVNKSSRITINSHINGCSREMKVSHPPFAPEQTASSAASQTVGIVASPSSFICKLYSFRQIVRDKNHLQTKPGPDANLIRIGKKLRQKSRKARPGQPS